MIGKCSRRNHLRMVVGERFRIDAVSWIDGIKIILNVNTSVWTGSNSWAALPPRIRGIERQKDP